MNANGLYANPVARPRALVPKQDRSTVDHADQQIHLAIVEKIRGRRPPANIPSRQGRSRTLTDLLECPIPQVMKEEWALRIRHSEPVLVHLWIYVTIRDEDVGPPIVVNVKEFQAEPEERDADGPEIGQTGKICKFSVAIIMKQVIGVVREIGFSNVGPPVVVVITGVDSHPRLFPTIAAVCDAGPRSNFAKSAFAVAFVQHGIFDFIHRDPKTLSLYFSASKVEEPKHAIHLGSWSIPLSGGSAEQLRQGVAFWQILDQHGIPNTIFRIPSNFPPVPTKGRTLSGMGTPDLRGTYGTFSFYTDDPIATPGVVEGGQVIPVQVENDRVTARLIGPNNSFLRGSPAATEPFSVAVDPVQSVVKISVQDQEFVLRESEWSNWIRVEFQLVPLLANVKGMCRFYLKQAHPRFQLYVSPINMDPADPALPISTPSSYSRLLTDEAGEFHTQGIAEDTKALSDGVLDDQEYLQQARTVFAEHRRLFEAEFPKFNHGVFFFYFSSLDLNSHMITASVSASAANRRSASMKFVPISGSPPIPMQVVCPIPCFVS